MNDFPNIYGFNKSSDAGPDNFSPAIFLGTCNFRCEYCMNAKLVLESHKMNKINIEDVRKFVKSNNCEWVNISGGEVTVHSATKLNNLMSEIKSWGIKVAISTNGYLPNNLKQVIKLIDYVTMDIKTYGSKHDELLANSKSNSFSKILESLSILREEKSKRNFDYEVRTTLYRDYVGEEEIIKIGKLLNEDERWMLQPFRHAKNMISPNAYKILPYKDEELKSIFELARNIHKNTDMRYV